MKYVFKKLKKVDTIEELKKKFTAFSSQELIDVGSDLNKCKFFLNSITHATL